VTTPPIRSLAVALLYFNKDLPQFERSLHANIDALRVSGLIDDLHLAIRMNMAVDMARNQIVSDLLRARWDAAVWLDTDMVYPDDALIRLVRMSNAGHPVAAGIYRRGVMPFHLLTRRSPRGGWSELDELREHRAGGVTSVNMTAGGYSIVRREVYEQFQKRVGLPWYCNWDFRWGTNQCGEDTFFMRGLHEMGVPVVVDPELHAVHWNIHGPVPVLDDQPEMEMCH